MSAWLMVWPALTLTQPALPLYCSVPSAGRAVILMPAAVPPSSKINQIARNYNLTFEPEQMREVIRGFLAGEAPKPKPDKKDPGKKKGAGDGEEVRGTMTLNEFSMKTGVPKAFILKSVGAPADTDPRKPVREWIHDTGKTMQDVRQSVADYRAGKR